MRTILRQLVVQILNWEAKLYLKKAKPKLIFVCGQINRTNTKEEIVRQLLLAGKNARGSFKGYNALIGLPLSILNLEAGFHSFIRWIKLLWQGFKTAIKAKSCAEIIVLEVSVENEAESREIMRNYQADCLVFTDFLSKISQKDSILTAFSILAENNKKQGTIIVNSDYPELRFKHDNLISCGTSPQADIILNNIIEQDNNQNFTYNFKEKSEIISLNKFSIHNVYAWAIAKYVVTTNII